MIGKPAAVLVAVSVIAGCLALVIENVRGLLAGIALTSLLLALVVDRLLSRRVSIDLDAMSTSCEDWVVITVLGGELAVTDRWDLSGGLRIGGIPAELKVRLHIRATSQLKLIESIELCDATNAMSESGNCHVAVDSGWLFFGDANVAQDVSSLEPIVEASFDRLASGEPLRTVVADAQGRCRGVICETGLGDGQYLVKWSTVGDWHVKAVFL